jgi:DNA-3-methyladenine glycosylase
VEAYLGPSDQASHARFGETARNRVMFGPAGIAYVYLVYGMYDCLNVVTGTPGDASALLIRAVEPLEGIEAMRLERVLRTTTRQRSMAAPGRAEAEAQRVAGLPVARLASGPGLVTAAFGITTAWTGLDLCDPGSALRLEEAPVGDEPITVVAGPRVGVGYAGEPWVSHPLRFAIAGDPAVSRPAPRPAVPPHPSPPR